MRTRSPEPAQTPVTVPADVASLLAGKWVGTPKIPTVDDNIELEFTKNKVGHRERQVGRHEFRQDRQAAAELQGRRPQVDFTFPNVDPWSVSGKLGDDGTITGIVFSIQGGTTVTFKKQTKG